MAPNAAWSSGTMQRAGFPAEGRFERLHDAAVRRHAADEAPRRGTTFLPFVIALLKLRATASQSPFRISSGVKPFCWAWIMSLLAKTEQRPAICAARSVAEHDVADVLDVNRRRPACWSRKPPVPAAQSPLVW